MTLTPLMSFRSSNHCEYVKNRYKIIASLLFSKDFLLLPPRTLLGKQTLMNFTSVEFFYELWSINGDAGYG